MVKPITLRRIPQTPESVDHELIWSSLIFWAVAFIQSGTGITRTLALFSTTLLFGLPYSFYGMTFASRSSLGPKFP